MIARDFLNNNHAAALATADSAGMPHVSIVYCVASEELTVYFSTRVQSRKFEDVAVRPEVSMAFYDETRLQTVQLSGTARRLENFDKEQEIMGRLMRLRFNKKDWETPVMKLFDRGTANEIAIMEVTPEEMTFADFGTSGTDKRVPIFRRII